MTTAVQVQYRRGTAAQVAAFTGAAGEMVVDTTNQRLVVQDGATAGGWPADLAVRTAVSDAAYTAKVTDRVVAYTAITAARTVTLPAASSYPTGTQLTIADESGSCSATNTITVARAGADTINGATSAVIASAYGYLALESNGSNAWTVVDAALTLANLPSIASKTVLGNNGGSSASPSALSVANLQALVAGQQIVFSVTGVNFNATGDTPIPITLPTGFTRYIVNSIRISNASASLTTAKAGLFTAASQGGTAIFGQTALTVSTSADGVVGNAQNLTGTAQSFTVAGFGTLYFNVGTVQGSAATATVTLSIFPLL